ncbi:CBS domain-containing protein [Rickettsiales bacterium]|nr:CBS domain-containing protein [Rickettsiales bacterium]
MQVKDIMTKEPSFVSPDDTINQAAQKMKKIECGILPVGEDKDHCIGIITDRDIVLRVLANGDDPKQAKVKEAMTKEVYFCHEDDNLDKAAELMRENKVNRLLVKDKSNHITGIITFGAMLWKTKNASEVGHMLDHAAPRKAVS